MLGLEANDLIRECLHLSKLMQQLNEQNHHTTLMFSSYIASRTSESHNELIHSKNQPSSTMSTNPQSQQEKQSQQRKTLRKEEILELNQILEIFRNSLASYAHDVSGFLSMFDSRIEEIRWIHQVISHQPNTIFEIDAETTDFTQSKPHMSIESKVQQVTPHDEYFELEQLWVHSEYPPPTWINEYSAFLPPQITTVDKHLKSELQQNHQKSFAKSIYDNFFNMKTTNNNPDNLTGINNCVFDNIPLIKADNCAEGSDTFFFIENIFKESNNEEQKTTTAKINEINCSILLLQSFSEEQFQIKDIIASSSNQEINITNAFDEQQPQHRLDLTRTLSRNINHENKCDSPNIWNKGAKNQEAIYINQDCILNSIETPKKSNNHQEILTQQHQQPKQQQSQQSKQQKLPRKQQQHEILLKQRENPNSQKMQIVEIDKNINEQNNHLQINKLIRQQIPNKNIIPTKQVEILNQKTRKIIPVIKVKQEITSIKQQTPIVIDDDDDIEEIKNNNASEESLILLTNKTIGLTRNHVHNNKPYEQIKQNPNSDDNSCVILKEKRIIRRIPSSKPQPMQQQNVFGVVNKLPSSIKQFKPILNGPAPRKIIKL